MQSILERTRLIHKLASETDRLANDLAVYLGADQEVAREKPEPTQAEPRGIVHALSVTLDEVEATVRANQRTLNGIAQFLELPESRPSGGKMLRPENNMNTGEH